MPCRAARSSDHTPQRFRLIALLWVCVPAQNIEGSVAGLAQSVQQYWTNTIMAPHSCFTNYKQHMLTAATMYRLTVSRFSCPPLALLESNCLTVGPTA
jgi:hypothetical protein